MDRYWNVLRFVTNPIGPVIARPTPSGHRGSWANTGGANPGPGGSLSFSRGSSSVSPPHRVVSGMENDLYGDLYGSAGEADASLQPGGDADGAGILRVRLATAEEQIKKLAASEAALKAQLANAIAERDRFGEQNEILLRNISCVFETAREEIRRKDKLIAELRTQQERR